LEENLREGENINNRTQRLLVQTSLEGAKISAFSSFLLSHIIDCNTKKKTAIRLWIGKVRAEIFQHFEIFVTFSTFE